MPLTYNTFRSGKPTSGRTKTVRNSIVALVGGAVLLAPLLATVPANAATPPSLPAVSAATPTDAQIPLTVALKSVNQVALQSLAVNSSKLTKNQRIAAVGALAPTDVTVDNVVKQFQDAGITVTGHDDWSVTVSVTKEQAEQLFNVNMTGTGTKVSTDDTPTIPDALKSSVSGVLGLDSAPLLTPAVYGYQAADLNASGNVTGASSGGAGMTVATVQFNGWNSNDLTQYAAKTNNSMPTVIPISVDNQSTVDTTNSTGAMEVALDQQQILDTAPKAKQRIYFAPNSGQGFYDAFNTIANDVPSSGITAVSMSWGFCETSVDAYTMSVLTSVIDRVVALGATTFAASGDYGSSSCGPNTAADVNFPASAPSVIGVGGTTMNKSGTTYTHTAWSGSGGGQSSVTARPSYQSALTLSGSNRLVPDISSVGDPNTGVYSYFGAGGGDLFLGGTSASTPIEAGQYVSTLASLGCTTGLGDIHTALYNHPADFVDVTAGSNGAYSATAGYDETTGLGVPQWGKLAYDLPLTGTCVAPTAPVTTPPAATTPPTTTQPTAPVTTAPPTTTAPTDPTSPPVTTPTQPVPTATTILGNSQSITSPNGQYVLSMQLDSNLVLYGNGVASHDPLWYTSTSGKPNGATLQVSTKGNLQVVSKDGKTVYWSSGAGTNGDQTNTVQVTNDGHILLQDASTGGTLWSPTVTGLNQLTRGGSLLTGQYIRSANQKFQLIFQPDGNLVDYQGGTAVWNSGTYGKAKGGFFIYQTDGNLVIYNAAGQAVWNSHTDGTSSTKLLLQSDGNLVDYNGGTAVWNSGASIPSANYITKGTVMYAGDSFKSNNDAYQFTFQADGNLVLYHGVTAIFNTGTSGKAVGGFFAYQTDGNLVVYNAAGKAVWNSGTSGSATTFMTVQDDGNLVLYNGAQPVWYSHTSGM